MFTQTHATPRRERESERDKAAARTRTEHSAGGESSASAVKPEPGDHGFAPARAEGPERSAVKFPSSVGCDTRCGCPTARDSYPPVRVSLFERTPQDTRLPPHCDTWRKLFWYSRRRILFGFRTSHVSDRAARRAPDVAPCHARIASFATRTEPHAAHWPLAAPLLTLSLTMAAQAAERTGLGARAADRVRGRGPLRQEHADAAARRRARGARRRRGAAGFPDRQTAIGAMIDKYLKCEAELDDRAVHLLFAANRWACSGALAARARARAAPSCATGTLCTGAVAFSGAKPASRRVVQAARRRPARARRGDLPRPPPPRTPSGAATSPRRAPPAGDGAATRCGARRVARR